MNKIELKIWLYVALALEVLLTLAFIWMLSEYKNFFFFFLSVATVILMLHNAGAIQRLDRGK